MVAVKHALSAVRAAYDFDTRIYDQGINCDGYFDEDGEWVETPSLTKQASKDECDINVMMARYQATGQFDNVNERPPQWGDVSNVQSYQDAQNLILDSARRFAALPAETRARFGNDPAQLLGFLNDDRNRDEAMELGLVDRPAPAAPPLEVRVVDPVEGSGEASPPKPAKPA